jgi:hypothetical protein
MDMLVLDRLMLLVRLVMLLVQLPPTILWGALPSNSYFRLYLNPTILRGKEGTTLA